ncbi:hypothetical protein [Bradyrhizobium elkanii]|uniref:Uncharacterized protein n=1 Tax=Bradyrhizobium elkanii TaxID=29448 RepID=A0A8I1Y6R8_BRAEL|nr:hypothetical protein [Bradyrhizobium elkanii]MBP1294287.1 hypothetical protein [Bradyrhizobium elkanii]
MNEQSEMDFGVFATAAANHARRRNAPPQPDRDGLFDAEGVTIIAGRRQCAVEVGSELFVDIQFKETKIRVTAIAPGKWDPVSILSACTRAHGGKVFEVDYATATPTNPGGVDELRIATIIGADGIKPYLSKKSRYAAGELGRWAPLQRPTEIEYIRSFRRQPAGKPTWAFRTLLWGHGGSRTSDYRVRRSLRALEDAGLLSIQLGPRGGMATAKCTWTARAYLAPARLAPADEEALGALAP